MSGGGQDNLFSVSFKIWASNLSCQACVQTIFSLAKPSCHPQLPFLKELCVFADQGAEKHEGAGQSSGVTDQEKELSTSAFQAFTVRDSFSLHLLKSGLSSRTLLSEFESYIFVLS